MIWVIWWAKTERRQNQHLENTKNCLVQKKKKRKELSLNFSLPSITGRVSASQPVSQSVWLCPGPQQRKCSREVWGAFVSWTATKSLKKWPRGLSGELFPFTHTITHQAKVASLHNVQPLHSWDWQLLIRCSHMGPTAAPGQRRESSPQGKKICLQ